ncbi:MAG: uroporphyrinogen decarboxylase [Alphaproteobacteria bacterium]|nr:uroporphyrinogen decarboxylase [Alphaproteobacteria bacterium]
MNGKGNSAVRGAEKPFLKALAGEASDRPPMWLMRQAGRYLPEYRAIRATVSGFLELCYTPELATEVTLQPIRRYGFDAAILFSDILVVPDALGQEVTFVEGEGPKLAPIRSAAEARTLSADWIRQRLAPVFETVESVRSKLPDETALIGFAGAPWTVACYMVEGGGSRDFTEVKRFAYQDPKSFQDVIDVLVDGTIDYLCAQVEAGADALQLFDTWAGVLPDDAFAAYVTEPARKIVAGVRAKHPDIPMIGFPRGAGVGYARYLDQTGVNGVSIDVAVDLDWAAKTLQPKGAVQGNLDPQRLLVGGDGLNAAADRILTAFSDGPFIFNLGHGVIKETPPEHVEALVERVRGR